jgi:hypothetical protein
LEEGKIGTALKFAGKLGKAIVKKLPMLLIKGREIGGDRAIEAFWAEIPDDKKGQFLKAAWERSKEEDAGWFWEIIKDCIDDFGISKEDKEALARKLNIDPKILEGADTFLV